MRIRTLLIFVAVIAIPLAAWARIQARRDHSRRLAADHRSRIVCSIRVGMNPGHYGVLPWTPRGEFVSRRQHDLDTWHLGLSEKYRKAADRPWLPVAPDPEPPRTAEGGPIMIPVSQIVLLASQAARPKP